MKKIFIVSIVSFFLFASLAVSYAGDIHLSKSAKQELLVLENSYAKLIVKNSLNTLDYSFVNSSKGCFVRLSVEGYASSEKVGMPLLPVNKSLIEVPLGATISYKIKSYTTEEIRLSDYGIVNQLFPAQLPVAKSYTGVVELVKNAQAYQTNAYLKSDLVKIEKLGIMRGLNLARLNICPFQYNPVKNTIIVYHNMVVEISFTGADEGATVELKKKNNSPYFSGVQSMVINYKPLLQKDMITKATVKYVIVSDPMFQATLQPFIQWKTKKGFNVIEAYTNNPLVGTTTTSIKAYLQGLYNAATPSDPAPSFVLFVGDVAQVPSFAGSTGTHPTDLYYCEYTGDFLPEVYYGRFSAENVDQLLPQINKTLEYEQYLMPDPTFLNQVVMIAGVDAGNAPTYGNGQINYGTQNYFNSTFGLTSHTYLYPASETAATQVIQDVNNGCGYANYTAHGSTDGWANPGFSVSDVNNLTNSHKYPLMVGNCCQTNKFDETVCFGEALLRASNKGAIGYIGASDLSYWDEDYFWGVGSKAISGTPPPPYSATNLGSYDRTFHSHGEAYANWYVTQGQMVHAGNLAVTQSSSSMTSYYWEMYHLMGDPSLMVYYSVPPVLSCSYAPFIPLAATTFAVNTEPYAYVAVSMGGVLHGADFADSTGMCNLTISPFTVPGSADVVITKQNRQPHIGTVNIQTPTGPYVVYKSHIQNDPTGNNNHLADFNELISLDVTLKNYGINDTAVSAIIYTADTMVTVIDSTHAWGLILQNDTLLKPNAFSFKVKNLITDQHTVVFTLKVIDNLGNLWTSTFPVKLNAPLLAAGNMVISDNGNHNGRLDPGETATITISNYNNGHCVAPNCIGSLSTPSNLITINNSTSTIGDLTTGGSGNATFSVTASSSATLGTYLPLNYTVESTPYQNNKTFNTMIGIVSEDWETASFTKFAWTQLSTSLWTITDTLPYEGVYCAQSGSINDNESTSIQIALNVLADDSISFYKKVSSEANYDFLQFYIDNVKIDEWSGTQGWGRVMYPVTTGNHTFRWTYSKDVSQSAGEDKGWIDYILFPPAIIINGVEDLSNTDQFIVYPNPANDAVQISFNLNQSAKVDASIYNSLGQKIIDLNPGNELGVGNHIYNASTKNLASGIYFVKLIAGNNQKTLKLIIHK
ncbi:MAG: C25 family cysteine peptidase [Bacteroidota bacterium]